MKHISAKWAIVLSAGCLFSFSLYESNVLVKPDNRGTINFSEHVAPIIYNKCATCHHPGGIAPMSLITYDEVFGEQLNIEDAINMGEMPPWPPDTSYTRFRHERVLTQAEAATILTWVNTGATRGDSTLAPPFPTFNSTGPTLGTPDLTITSLNYTSKAYTVDDYVCFSIPSGLLQDRKIQAIEVEPGNSAIVHHALIFIDQAGTYTTDTSGVCVGPNNGTLVGEFTPGSVPIVYPGGGNVFMGVTMQAGSNVVLAMHYPSGSGGQQDQTKVHFYFYPTAVSNVREVSIDDLIYNWSFCVPANDTQYVTASFPPVVGGTPGNYSIIGIFPHMHLLGKSIKSYAVKNNNDTIPLININNWDFHWQGIYQFPYPVKVPSGSHLYGEGVYDNTTNNPDNPSFPPVNVCAGLNTTDEMFLIYYQYLPYVTGDENLNIDSLMALSALSISERSNAEIPVLVYPNPSDGTVYFKANLNPQESVTIDIYDLKGSLVYTHTQGAGFGSAVISWDGSNLRGGNCIPGTYLYKFKNGNRLHYGRIVRIR